MVEFAIVLLPLCIILFGIISYGVDLSFKQSVTQAADEAGRAAGTAPYDADHTKAIDAAKAAANHTLSGFGKACGEDGMTCTFVVADCGSNSCMTVELSYDLDNYPLLPKFPVLDAALPSTISARAVVQVNGS
jgi:Flp pilus assembly protein TadG